MAVAIRPARPGEAGLVFAFVRELAAYERLGDAVDATEQMIDAALFGPSPRVFCDIAEWEGEPAGFALWFQNFSSFRGRHGLYLEDLFVRPAFRRRGIGRALFRHLARRCAAEGWTRFEWAVLDWNAPSIAFYKSLGAELLQEWTVCRLAGDALARLGQPEVP
jgi:GNAT superfamily N-acetyltransferase